VTGFLSLYSPATTPSALVEKGLYLNRIPPISRIEQIFGLVGWATIAAYGSP
jgi:hypothetical protein